MPLFRSKKIHIETLGEYLLHAREALDLSIGQVKKLTQIPEKYLEPLERGDYSKLPSDIYVKGFLKRLSAAYGIPQSSLLEQFEKERGVERKLEQDKLKIGAKNTFASRIIITPKTLSITAVAVLVLASGIYLYWQFRSIQAPPQLTLQYPEADTLINSQSILLRGSTQAGSKVFVNEQPIAVDEVGDFREIINLAEGQNLLVVRSENKFGRSTILERTVVVKMLNVASSTSTEVLTSGGLVVEVVVGPEDAYIKVESDGGVIFDGVLAGGKKQIFKAENILLLTTGNAGSTHVTFNGKDLGVLGAGGEVLSNIEFSR